MEVLELVGLGALVGIDNLRISVALGMVGLSKRRARLFALSFGTFEALMPLAGLLGGAALARVIEPWTNYVGAAALVVCGLAMIFGALKEDPAAAIAGRPSVILTLPLALSLDNLAAGFGLGTLGAPVAAAASVIGATSALAAVIGLKLGSRLRRLMPARAEAIAGMALLLTAVLVVVRD